MNEAARKHTHAHTHTHTPTHTHGSFRTASRSLGAQPPVTLATRLVTIADRELTHVVSEGGDHNSVAKTGGRPEYMRQGSVGNVDLLDRFVGFSTMPGFVSRDADNSGSTFLVVLDEVLREMSGTEDWRAMFDRVQIKTSENTMADRKRTFHPADVGAYSLLRKLYFPVSWLCCQSPRKNLIHHQNLVPQKRNSVEFLKVVVGP